MDDLTKLLESVPKLITTTPEDKEEHIQVVRLTTHCYRTNQNCIHLDKRLYTLKRLCKGHQLLDEEVSMGGAESALNIIDFHKLPDGVYKVATCNISRDWETGHIDGYDLVLIPFEMPIQKWSFLDNMKKGDTFIVPDSIERTRAQVAANFKGIKLKTKRTATGQYECLVVSNKKTDDEDTKQAEVKVEETKTSA